MTRLNYFLFSLGYIIVLVSCKPLSESFRTKAGQDHSVKYKTNTRMKVTGLGCALDVQEAQRISKRTAEYNLRSIIGNVKYITSFREIDRYVSDNQTCVTTEIESREL